MIINKGRVISYDDNFKGILIYIFQKVLTKSSRTLDTLSEPFLY